MSGASRNIPDGRGPWRRMIRITVRTIIVSAIVVAVGFAVGLLLGRSLL
jgi:hypothetical protein